MKKILFLISVLLCSCVNIKSYTFKVMSYYYAYVWKSDNITETIHIAKFEDNIHQKCFLEVPLSFHEEKIKVYYTGDNKEYHINTQQYNFYGYSNGWEVLK